MATYEGHFIGSVLKLDPVAVGVNPFEPTYDMVSGDITKEYLPAPSGFKVLSGVFSGGGWSVSCHQRVYFNETTLDLGLIVVDRDFDFEVWNAGREALTFLSVEATTPSGFIIEGITPGTVIVPETTKQWKLTITKDGAPSQDTILTFNFSGGVSFHVRFFGRRVVVFAFPIDAISGVKVRYNFETVVSRSPKFKEQRRALRDKPFKVIELEMSFFDDDEKQKFLNQVHLNQEKIVAIPHPTEELPIIADPQGLTNIFIEGNTHDLWEFPDAIIAVLYDERDGDHNELINVDDVLSDRIVADTPITNNFEPGHCFIAPATTCIVPMLDGDILSPLVSRFKIEFEEFS